MKPTLILILTVVLACGSLPVAAQAPSGNEVAKETLEANNWALQFGISDNFTLQTFQGAVLSIKRQTSLRSAWRAGVGLNVGASDRDGGSSVTSNDSLIFESGDALDGNSFSLQLILQYLRYAHVASRVAFFLGGGPHGGFGWSDQEATSGSGMVQSTNTATITSWTVGLNGVLGIEWFASSAISLHAEYGAVVQRSWSDRETVIRTTTGTTTQVRTDNDESSVWEFDSKGLLFGLSVYF